MDGEQWLLFDDWWMISADWWIIIDDSWLWFGDYCLMIECCCVMADGRCLMDEHSSQALASNIQSRMLPWVYACFMTNWSFSLCWTFDLSQIFKPAFIDPNGWVLNSNMSRLSILPPVRLHRRNGCNTNDEVSWSPHVLSATLRTSNGWIGTVIYVSWSSMLSLLAGNWNLTAIKHSNVNIADVEYGTRGWASFVVLAIFNLDDVFFPFSCCKYYIMILIVTVVLMATLTLTVSL